MVKQPKITVLILESNDMVNGSLNGNFLINGFGLASGVFSVMIKSGKINLSNRGKTKIFEKPKIRLESLNHASFTLYQVTIGNHFHWERKKDLTYEGDLIFRIKKDKTLQAINEIPVENYLTSVISSEVNTSSPLEFLKAHTVISRSWLLSILDKKDHEIQVPPDKESLKEDEIICWYGHKDHKDFDVCSNDHCQRYYGIPESGLKKALDAINQTYGLVITYKDRICRTNFSKVCGGITENSETAWSDSPIDYLKSRSDSFYSYPPITNEKDALKWISSDPDVFCNVKDREFLKDILYNFDLETENPFRWRVEYSRNEIGDIIKEKSGFDLGSIKKIIPILRGPSGRIYRLKIIGSKKEITVGKELEIRRWLSRNHLLSSAFFLKNDIKRFTFYGAGWGHGVGLCQVGAAHMAIKGFSMEEILKHYYSGIDIKKIY